MNKNLSAKFKEALISVLPITAIVLLLNFTVAPMTGGTVALFLAGAVLLIVGMALFSLGADIAITIAEPDLQVLADQVPSVPNMTLIITVALGVGVFLVLALLRIIFQKNKI